MTITLPSRLIILHFSHIAFTDDLTFIYLLLRRRKLRYTAFPAKAENCVRYVAPPLRCRPTLLGSSSSLALVMLYSIYCAR